MLNQVYADKSKVKGINLNDPTVKEEIYQQYLKAYKKGVFNYIKEEINSANGEPISRKYFSGGILAEGAAAQDKLIITTSAGMVTTAEKNRQRIFGVYDFATLVSTKPFDSDTAFKRARRRSYEGLKMKSVSRFVGGAFNRDKRRMPIASGGCGDDNDHGGACGRRWQLRVAATLSLNMIGQTLLSQLN